MGKRPELIGGKEKYGHPLTFVTAALWLAQKLPCKGGRGGRKTALGPRDEIPKLSIVQSPGAPNFQGFDLISGYVYGRLCEQAGRTDKMYCKHLRISQQRKTEENGIQVDAVETANCRYKLTGEAKAKEVYLKLLELGIEHGASPGLHCPFYPNGDYSTCPWYIRDYK